MRHIAQDVFAGLEQDETAQAPQQRTVDQDLSTSVGQEGGGAAVNSHDSEALASLAIRPEQFRLDGMHVLVTGGGRGLGQGIALSAIRCGAEVTIVARSGKQLKATSLLADEIGGKCYTEEVDLSRPEDIQPLVDRLASLRPIDGVVHAAGIQIRKEATSVSIDDWRRLQAVNMDAPFFLSTAIARHQMEAGRAGSHVFIGSLNSTIGMPRVAPYAASKTALLGMARVMSTEWAGRGLRANVIAPGYVHTELTNDLLADPANRARIQARIPEGGLGLPRDVGALVVFLLADASRYLTGQLINIDGGWLAS